MPYEPEPPLPRTQHLDIVFDGPRGSDAPRFVEAEDDMGRSIRLGTWVQRKDGYWAIRIDRAQAIHWLGTRHEQL